VLLDLDKIKYEPLKYVLKGRKIMNNTKTRILIKTSLGYNGVAGVTMNYYKNMPHDRINVDFAVCDAHEYMRKDFVQYILTRGSKIIRLSEPYNNIFKYSSEMIKMLINGKYEVVHIHGNSGNMFIDVLLAALCGVRVRITHCHNTSCTYKLLHSFFKPFLNIMATDRFACSNAAGRWLYNDKAFKVIQNGIDFITYRYNKVNRFQIRKKYKLSEKLVLCHIGSFIDAKNHSYLIDIFNQIVKIEPESTLLLIGSGPLQDEVSEKITKMSLESKVVFIGNTTEVEKYYSASDVFVLPSKFEGLPLVLVEAQASALPCVIADNITKEVEITGLVTSLSIESDPKIWAKKIVEVAKKSIQRNNMKFNENAELFDILKNSKKMEEFYNKRVNMEYRNNG
jgi:glycosyltransferase involved in cell wall biosynthesis